jgi:hypothetical protein
MLGGCTTRSDARSINAAATRPPRCASRPPASSGNVSKIANREGPSPAANQAVVCGSFCTGGSAEVSKLAGSASCPALASRTTSSATVLTAVPPPSPATYKPARGQARRKPELLVAYVVLSDRWRARLRRSSRGPGNTQPTAERTPACRFDVHGISERRVRVLTVRFHRQLSRVGRVRGQRSGGQIPPFGVIGL